jgi:VWFA-related protein
MQVMEEPADERSNGRYQKMAGARLFWTGVSRMRWATRIALVGLGFSPLSALHGQTAEVSASEAATLSARSTLVVVPALVRDKAGRVIYTMTADAFTLTDDGVPQKLMLEQDTGAEPLALVVVIEADAAYRFAGWHPYTHTGAKDRFLGVPAMIEAIAGGVPHRLAVVGFDSEPELELPFTANFDSVGDVIEQLDKGNTGDHGAGILDSVVFAVDLLRKAPSGYRRAILLLSETNDRGSKSSMEQALRAITETNTTIYSVAFSTPFHEASEYGSKQLPTKADEIFASRGSRPPLSPAELLAERVLQGALFGISLENPNPNPPGGCLGIGQDTGPVYLHDRLARVYDCLGQLAPPLALAKMAMIAATDTMRVNVPKSVARLTGGEYFQFNGAKSLEEDLGTLANHVPNRYVLSFQPQMPHAGLHVIGVELKDYPQLKVTARSSYWAEAEGAAGESPEALH